MRSVHDVTLVFGGELVTALPPDALRLGPDSADGHVFPPILTDFGVALNEGHPVINRTGALCRVLTVSSTSPLSVVHCPDRARSGVDARRWLSGHTQD